MILDPRSQEVLIPDRSLGADQSLDSTFLQVVSTHAALLPPSPPTPQNGEFRSLFRIRYWLSAHLKMLIINLVPTLAARRLYNEETPGWKWKTLAVVDDCSGWLLWMVYNCNQCRQLFIWMRTMCCVSLASFCIRMFNWAYMALCCLDLCPEGIVSAHYLRQK